MKLNKQDIRRLTVAIRLSTYQGMTFEEIADYQMFSEPCAKKIRGTYNKLKKIQEAFNISADDAERAINGDVTWNNDAMLVFLLMHFQGFQMTTFSLADEIKKLTGKHVSRDDLKPILWGLSAMTNCAAISYTDTHGLDKLTIYKVV